MTIEELTTLQTQALRGEAITLFPAAAYTNNGNGSAVPVSAAHQRWVFVLDITASAHEAGDTLDVFVDVLAPDGATWLNAAHFTQQSGAGAARKEFVVLDASNPGVAAINVTADAAAGAVRPALFGSEFRGRRAIADSGDADSSHTFSLMGFGA